MRQTLRSEPAGSAEPISVAHLPGGERILNG